MRQGVRSADAGYAGEVSNYLHRNVFEDDVLEVTTPFGDLVLQDDDAPLLLISAGIGCTPMMGMLRQLADTADTLSQCCTPIAHPAVMPIARN